MATYLTAEETDEFLKNERTLVLSSLKKDGAPVAHALWFTYVDGAIYVNIQRRSFKYQNIQRDDRVCCLVEAGETYFDLKGVMIQGRAATVEDPALMERVRAAGDEKNARIGSGMEEMPGWFSGSRTRRLDRGDRVMLRISMDKVTTWNFAQVREHYLKKQ